MTPGSLIHYFRALFIGFVLSIVADHSAIGESKDQKHRSKSSSFQSSGQVAHTNRNGRQGKVLVGASIWNREVAMHSTFLEWYFSSNPKSELKSPIIGDVSLGLNIPSSPIHKSSLKSSITTAMAPTPPYQNLAFHPRASSSKSQAPNDVLATINEGVTSIDVTYKVVWTACEPPPPGFISQTPSVSRLAAEGIWTSREPPPPGFLSQTPSVSRLAAEGIWTSREPPPPGLLSQLPPLNGRAAEFLSTSSQNPFVGRREAGSASIRFQEPPGSVRITGSAVARSVRDNYQSQHSGPSVPTPQPMPEEKLPCTAILKRGTLGALSTCIYNAITDNFSDFSANDGTWAHQNGYHDYGDVQMSTRKW